MTPDANPYAAPKAELVPVVAGDRDEALAIRRAHLRHEAGLRSLGSLWMFGGLVLLVGSVGLLFSADLPAAVPAVSLVLGVAFLVCALDVRRLSPRARVTGSILAAFSLINIPVGTLIGLYALYLFHSEKGRVVLDVDYARIRELTPDVKYRTSVLVWIALAVLLAAVAFGVLAAFFG